MGNYNSAYKKYYSNMTGKNKKNHQKYYTYNSNKDSNNKIFKRVLQELIGVFLLFLVIVTCKIYVNPKTEAVYNYSKRIVDTSYDYNKFINVIKNIKPADIQEKIVYLFEQVKSSVLGVDSLNERVNNEFSLPVMGNIKYEDDKGMKIFLTKVTKILASSDGEIREQGINDKGEKYIIISHGHGIDTKYTNLTEVTMNSKIKVKKGEMIGTAGKPNGLVSYLNFQILYMGQSEDLEKSVVIAK